MNRELILQFDSIPFYYKKHQLKTVTAWDLCCPRLQEIYFGVQTDVQCTFKTG